MYDWYGAKCYKFVEYPVPTRETTTSKMVVFMQQRLYLALTKESTDVWSNKWHAKELEAEHHGNTIVQVSVMGCVVTCMEDMDATTKNTEYALLY